MNPRRPDSKKWTQMPKELTQQIRSAIEEGFRQELKNHSVITEGKIFQNEVVFRVGFVEKGRLKQPNFEISFDIGDNKDDVWNQLQLGLDLIQATMLDYLTNEESIELPLSWQKINFKDHLFYFQFSTANSELEAMADKLLGVSKVNLVETAEETEDAYELAEISDEQTLDFLKSKRHLH